MLMELARGEECALVQLDVGEGLFDQALAIVERAGDFERGDIFAERGKLFFLRVADAFRRIENDDANSRDAQESMCDGAARVAGGCHQNGERARFAADEIAHHAGHEAGAEILEGQRRPVEQLENMKAWRERNHLYRKIDRLANDLPQDVFGHIGRCKRRYDPEADFGKRQRAEFFEFLRRAAGDFDRHIEAAVGSQSPQYSAAQRRQRCLSGCAAVSHLRGIILALF